MARITEGAGYEFKAKFDSHPQPVEVEWGVRTDDKKIMIVTAGKQRGGYRTEEVDNFGN